MTPGLRNSGNHGSLVTLRHHQIKTVIFHFLQICSFSDRGQEPDRDVQCGLLDGMCNYEDEL